jgi:Uma2 family endonuclease
MGSSFELLALPAKIVPAAPMSDEEFLAFCEANEPYQLEINEKGEILVMTPSRPKGGNLEGYVFGQLDAWAEDGSKGLAVNSNTIFRLPDSSLRMPDAALISAEKWNSLTVAEREQLPRYCPDFVVEVRSPSDRAAAVERKMGKWMANGARLGWLIDPVRKLAIVYRPELASETSLRPEFLDGEGPVAGFRLKMERFWA